MGSLRVTAVMSNHSDRFTGECWDEMRQFLQQERTYFFGLIKMWVTIEVEDVPSFAWMQAGCFGSTDWKSKFRYIPGVVFIKHIKD